MLLLFSFCCNWHEILVLWICRPKERCKMGTTTVRRQFCSWRSNPDRTQQPVIMKSSRRSGLAASGVFDQDCRKVHVGVTLTWLYSEDCSYWAVVCSAAASDVWRCRLLQMKSLLEKKPLPAKLLYRDTWWACWITGEVGCCSMSQYHMWKMLSNTRHRL